MAKPKRRARKQSLYEWLWSEASAMKRLVTAALTTLALAGGALTAWGSIEKFRSDRYVRIYGEAPHASVAKLTALQQSVENDLQVIAQNSVGEISARQIGRQQVIRELESKCNVGRCSPYDRQALTNYRLDWQREQQMLERLRDIERRQIRR